MRRLLIGLTYVLVISISANLYGQERKLKIDKRYLNLPVSNKLDTQHVKIMIGKEVYREFDIQLAGSDPDFWVFVDMKDKLGKTATLQLEKSVGKNWDLPYFSDRIAGADSLYSEKLRPQFHYTSKRGWNNDPNGMVYHNGEYHLYYQHNPYGWNWGNMHWGHAVSKDLVHWEELPEAIYPASYHDHVFSGSAVIDKDNTSGFGKGKNVPLVAAYTSTGRGESIAYSLDNGLTFQEYENNPVVKHDGRDPKIFWYAPGEHWVMVIYDETTKKTDNGLEYRNRTFHILNSKDLKNWTFQSEIPGFYECPELFELAEEGNPTNKKWIIYGANAQYLIGDFDGKTFRPESPKYEMINGIGYASQTFNNSPDDRRIQISWGNGAIAPGMPFNQLMLFPVELSLQNTADGLRVLPKPIDEIEKLLGEKHEWNDIVISGGEPFSSDFSKDVMHIKAEFQILDDFGFVMDINGFKLEYSAVNYKLNDVFLRPIAGKLKLDILVDKTSIEIFGNDGRAYITKAYIPKEGKLDVKVYSTHPNDGNKTVLENLTIYEMKSMWD
jgi:fructan beta-fructosidase